MLYNIILYITIAIYNIILYLHLYGESRLSQRSTARVAAYAFYLKSAVYYQLPFIHNYIV